MSHIHRLDILHWIDKGEVTYYDAVIPAVETFGVSSTSNMSHIHRLNILHWIHNGEASYDVVIPAVERFGEAAVKRQAKWVEATIRKRFDEKHIALLQELPSEEALERCKIPHITCASPFCPNFDRSIEAGSTIVAIEPKKNLTMPYVPYKPIACLDEVYESPLDGNNNWRGRGEHDVLWLHLTCLEAHSSHRHEYLEPRYSECPTLDQPLAAEAEIIQPDPRSFTAGTEAVHLDSPSLQTLYKWKGVVQLEKALAFEDDNKGFYINGDEDAAYIVEEHSKVRGNVHGIRVETTGAQARGQLLSVLLRRIDGRKTEILKREAEKASNHGHVEFAMTVERRIAQLENDQRQAAASAGPTGKWRERGQQEGNTSNEAHIEGLEMVQWTLSRPCSSTAAENDNLGEGLIPRYDTNKWGALSPEDATLIFWNRVPWRLGPPNGHLWLRFPARVVRMSAAIPDDASTLASDTASKVETWPMSEARPRRSSPESAYEPRHWEKALIRMGRFRLTRSKSEIDRDENVSSADLQMDDSCSGLDSTWSSEGSKVSEAGDSSPETHDSRSKVDEFPEVDLSMSEGDGASSDSESACSDDS